MEYTVTAIQNNKSMSQIIDIAECKNKIGEVIVTTTPSLMNPGEVKSSVAVKITAIPADVAAKIDDKELMLFASATKPGMLVGKLTPKGKHSKVDGGISVADRPEFKELLNALNAANTLIMATRNEMFRAGRPAEPIVPEGMVKITFITSKCDGWVKTYRDEFGNEFDSPKLAGGNDLGTAWITPETHAEMIGGLVIKEKNDEAKNITRLENIVKHGESLKQRGFLVSRGEQQRLAREWDNLNNEGAEGYNPYREELTIDDVEEARYKLQQQAA